MRNNIKNIIVAIIVTASLISCEQERLDPVLTTAEGGGTLTEYMAYTIASTDPGGSNVNGRIVFWKDNLDRTLVQISLYNTIPGIKHPALMMDGPVGDDTATTLELDVVSGDSGELDTNKFHIIADTEFYTSLPTMDVHLNILMSESDNTIIATGNLGINTEPVETN
ncbi:hypothetical protein HZY62_01185 [Maribacter polysiphoniae]|uniref:CHRD domain-containing protein n=1 Tax=Maribacter polysiphoniae TaxID=429344 RepID=A0A316E5E8_9FLAO|nr:hypothetical protein [Maribacter polysiphoniae]MBD1259186.1 hypothetical protein [Maribacter polysiphoniae]PWK24742.1 hypothetical protein LX92_01107 [Maribacter polysiphoniae]